MKLSNDYLEGRWAAELYKDVELKFSPRNDIRHLVRPIIDDETFDVFGFCLSAEKDLLSQWRAYADDGRGFCIGYNSNSLAHLYDANASYNIVQYGRVIYEKQEQIEVLRQFLYFCDLSHRNDGDYSRQFLAVRQTDTHSELLCQTSKLFFLKNPAFREEQEWRFLALRPITAREGSEIYAQINDIEYYCDGSLIKPCITLYFDPRNPCQEIKEIILGPKNSSKLHIIRSLLESNGLKDVHISLSSASYR